MAGTKDRLKSGASPSAWRLPCQQPLGGRSACQTYRQKCFGSTFLGRSRRQKSHSVSFVRPLHCLKPFGGISGRSSNRRKTSSVAFASRFDRYYAYGRIGRVHRTRRLSRKPILITRRMPRFSAKITTSQRIAPTSGICGVIHSLFTASAKKTCGQCGTSDMRPGQGPGNGTLTPHNTTY
jgi:hypothetical protein